MTYVGTLALKDKTQNGFSGINFGEITFSAGFDIRNIANPLQRLRYIQTLNVGAASYRFSNSPYNWAANDLRGVEFMFGSVPTATTSNLLARATTSPASLQTNMLENIGKDSDLTQSGLSELPTVALWSDTTTSPLISQQLTRQLSTEANRVQPPALIATAANQLVEAMSTFGITTANDNLAVKSDALLGRDSIWMSDVRHASGSLHMA